jgi:hypothetical protein
MNPVLQGSALRRVPDEPGFVARFPDEPGFYRGLPYGEPSFYEDPSRMCRKAHDDPFSEAAPKGLCGSCARDWMRQGRTLSVLLDTK